MSDNSKEEKNEDSEKKKSDDLSTERNLSPNGDEIPSKKSRVASSPSKDSDNLYSGVPASPPKYISFEQIMMATNGLQNMALAHEIVVDDSFKLKGPDEKAGLEKRIQSFMHQAFFDILREEIESDPPSYTQALSLVAEIKQMVILLLLPHQSRIRSEIDEVLDLELIRQQVENNAIDIHRYTNYLIDFMSRMCAPVRDESIVALRKQADVVDIFRGILELLSLMKMDMANFNISLIRPYLQQHSVTFERQKFDEFLAVQKEAGVDGLLKTRLWIQTAANIPPRQISGPAPGPSSQTVNITPFSILNESYLLLLQSSIYEDPDSFPETLVMDIQRFNKLQLLTWKLTLVCAMLLVTYNIVGGSISGITGFKDKLKSHALILIEDCEYVIWCL